MRRRWMDSGKSGQEEKLQLRDSHTAAITKTVMISTQRGCILLDELLRAEFAHARSTQNAFSLHCDRLRFRFRCSVTRPRLLSIFFYKWQPSQRADHSCAAHKTKDLVR